MHVESRILPARIEQWETVREFIETYLEQIECSAKVSYEILVSAEELFTNIASYAYENEDGMAEVSCGVNEENGVEFRFSFKDWGTPYDPFSRPDPDFEIPFEERRIGGLGVYMVKKFMDHVEYRYENGCNIVMIGKKL